MRIRQAFLSSAGAVALTVVAAASALAVNFGLLGQPSGDSVGTLTPDQAEVTTSVPAAADRYLTVYVEDPAPAAPVLPSAVSTPVAPASGPSADEYEGEDDEYEGEDDEYEGEDDEYEGEDDEYEGEHEEYEGADDDD
jgi:hypothetical protein